MFTQIVHVFLHISSRYIQIKVLHFVILFLKNKILFSLEALHCKYLKWTSICSTLIVFSSGNDACTKHLSTYIRIRFFFYLVQYVFQMSNTQIYTRFILTYPILNNRLQLKIVLSRIFNVLRTFSVRFHLRIQIKNSRPEIFTLLSLHNVCSAVSLTSVGSHIGFVLMNCLLPPLADVLFLFAGLPVSVRNPCLEQTNIIFFLFRIVA